MRRNIRKSEGTSDLDILFTVSRGDSHGYYRPNFIRQRHEQNIVELADDTGLQTISLTTEVCRRDVCVKGGCRDRLSLDDAAYVRYNINDESFYAPRHTRTFECICREGFGGKRLISAAKSSVQEMRYVLQWIRILVSNIYVRSVLLEINVRHLLVVKIIANADKVSFFILKSLTLFLLIFFVFIFLSAC
ncbi:Cadherin-4 [Toxocara canis]|uniref:Cadherin-4 n=1 Tax=Toxocara canis TaxID=6265 RepID=A0A0B2V921_TOXCA|nr:Cadherin-4 [Toxocara canis]